MVNNTGIEKEHIPLEVVDFWNIQKAIYTEAVITDRLPTIIITRAYPRVLWYIMNGTDKETNTPFMITVDEAGILIDGLRDADKCKAITQMLESCYTGMERREMREGMETV